MKHIPNTITLLNLLSGTFGIIFFAKQDLESSVYCIFISGLLDFFDGFAARLLKVSTPIGKDLDSLADVVSFGVLPGLLLFEVSQSLFQSSDIIPPLVSYLALFIPLCSALRLAKFNHQASQFYDFRGLATPANAIYTSAIVMSISQKSLPQNIQTYLLLTSLIALPFLLISNIRLFSAKIQDITLSKNIDRILFLSLSLTAILLMGWNSAVVILPLYLLISIFVTPRIRPL